MLKEINAELEMKDELPSVLEEGWENRGEYGSEGGSRKGKKKSAIWIDLGIQYLHSVPHMAHYVI